MKRNWIGRRSFAISARNLGTKLQNVDQKTHGTLITKGLLASIARSMGTTNRIVGQSIRTRNPLRVPRE
jgi:hypothetical protein